MEKFEKHLINWLIIAFFLIIDIALIPLMFMYFWPEQALQIGDIFTWTGAIIGGVITYLGVRLTLKYNERNRQIELFNKKIKVVIKAIENIKYIISFENYIYSKKASDNPSIIAHLLDQLYQFREDISIEIKEMVGIIDWEVVKYIDFRSKKFLKLEVDEKDIVIIDATNTSQIIEDYFEAARDIYTKLENYKKTLEKQYIKYKKLNF